MNEKKLISIVENLGESELVEYKTNYFDQTKLGKYISGLANSAALKHQEEAYMIWGVSDEGKIVGTDFTMNRDIHGEPFDHFLSRTLEPCKYDVEEFSIKGKRLVVMTVYASKETITEFKGERYIHTGSSLTELRRVPHLEAKLWRVLSHDEFSLVEERSYRQDLTFRIFRIYLDESKIEYTEENFLSNFKLLTSAGDYNYLAFLLSDQNDIAYKIVKYDGKDKMSNMVYRKEFSDRCILKSIDDVIDFLGLHENKMRTYFNAVSMRYDEFLFDIDAVGEAWKNACVHNDYSGKTGPSIFIFTDHLEVFSHGSPLSVQTKSNFLKAMSKPINPDLARIFMRVDKYDESGKGVKTILRSYKSDVFLFDDDDQFFVVSFPFNEKALSGTVKVDDEHQNQHNDEHNDEHNEHNNAGKNEHNEHNEHNNEHKSAGKNEEINPENEHNEHESSEYFEDEFIGKTLIEKLEILIKTTPDITLNEMAAITGKSKITIRRAIKSGNTIKFVGNTRGGHWIISNNEHE